MSGINSHFAASDALTALQEAEEAILAQTSPRLRLLRTVASGEHHDYLRVAQVLEAEALGAARNFAQWGAAREEDDHKRSYARSRSREFSVLASRFGEAWVL